MKHGLLLTFMPCPRLDQEPGNSLQLSTNTLSPTEEHAVMLGVCGEASLPCKGGRSPWQFWEALCTSGAVGLV